MYKYTSRDSKPISQFPSLVSSFRLPCAEVDTSHPELRELPGEPGTSKGAWGKGFTGRVAVATEHFHEETQGTAWQL